MNTTGFCDPPPVALSVAVWPTVPEAGAFKVIVCDWTAGLTVMVWVTEPLALVVSVAVTVTEYVPAAVALPEVRPAGLIDRPGGRSAAEKVRPHRPSLSS